MDRMLQKNAEGACPALEKIGVALSDEGPCRVSKALLLVPTTAFIFRKESMLSTVSTS